MSQPPRSDREQELLAKLRTLPSTRLAEVEDFVDALCGRGDGDPLEAAARISQRSFACVWDNPADAEYDGL